MAYQDDPDTKISGVTHELPLVSVCVPARNAEKTLAITIESVLNQTYPNLEVIVSDYHSTDQTLEIAKLYHDPRVSVYINDQIPSWATNAPGYITAFVNWNFVLSRGRGKYLCLYHADDIYDPDIVKLQVELMEANGEAGAVFTTLRTVGEDGQPIRMGSSIFPPEFVGRQVFTFDELFNALLKYNNFIPAPSVMMRKTALYEAGEFDGVHFQTSADLEMWLRIAQKYPIGMINKPLLNYRISQKQFGAQYNELRTSLADYFLVIDHFLSNSEIRRNVDPEALARYDMEKAADQIYCAMNLLVQGQNAEAQIRLREAIHWNHMIRAICKPIRLARFLLGIGLIASISLGLGTMVGRTIYNAYHIKLQYQKQSV